MGVGQIFSIAVFAKESSTDLSQKSEADRYLFASRKLTDVIFAPKPQQTTTLLSQGWRGQLQRYLRRRRRVDDGADEEEDEDGQAQRKRRTTKASSSEACRSRALPAAPRIRRRGAHNCGTGRVPSDRGFCSDSIRSNDDGRLRSFAVQQYKHTDRSHMHHHAYLCPPPPFFRRSLFSACCNPWGTAAMRWPFSTQPRPNRAPVNGRRW